MLGIASSGTGSTGTFAGPHLEVQVVVAGARVPRVADVADQLAGDDRVADGEPVGEAGQMEVAVPRVADRRSQLPTEAGGAGVGELPRQHAVLHCEHVLAERARRCRHLRGAPAPYNLLMAPKLLPTMHFGSGSIGKRSPLPVATIRSAGRPTRAPSVRSGHRRGAGAASAGRDGSIGDEAPAIATTPHRKSPDNATESGAVERRGGVTSWFMADVGQRVLISGMGGEIGSRVASLLENEPWVESLEGIDGDPPRRRLRRTVFHRIVPGDHDRIVDVVTKFDPHVLVHLAVWEPHSRANPDRARLLTDDAATSILGAAAECRSLESIVVRSGIEIYGRARGSVTRPDESARINPTSGFGKMLAGIELTAATIGDAHRRGRRSAAVRPGDRPARPEPARAVPAHGRRCRSARSPTRRSRSSRRSTWRPRSSPPPRIRLAEPVNVVAPGAITAFHAIRRGRRVPVPMIGPDWVIARGALLPRRGTDPRPCARVDAPRAARRRRSCVGSARSRARPTRRAR